MAKRALTPLVCRERQLAREPGDLERFFVERANAGDVEGLVALYEPGALLKCDDGRVIVGREQLRAFFAKYLVDLPQLVPSVQQPTLLADDLALTSSLHSNGDTSIEVARRQPGGSWLWVIDQFKVGCGERE